MTNLYVGAPDASQDESPAPSFFHKRYKQLTPEEIALHDEIKDKADELAVLFAKTLGDKTIVSGGHSSVIVNLAENKHANVTLALRHLEDAVYRAVKALIT